MAESRKPIEYYRKVHPQGRGGGVIYLPKEWLQKLGITPGEQTVRITDIKDGRLIISKPH